MVHNRVSDWLVETGLPASIVRHPSFRRLFEPGIPTGYIPPSPQLLMKLQISEVSKMKSLCQHLLKTRVIAGTLTADGWTSVSGDSYFGILLHYVDQQTCMQTPLLLAVVCKNIETC